MFKKGNYIHETSISVILFFLFCCRCCPALRRYGLSFADPAMTFRLCILLVLSFTSKTKNPIKKYLNTGNITFLFRNPKILHGRRLDTRSFKMQKTVSFYISIVYENVTNTANRRKASRLAFTRQKCRDYPYRSRGLLRKTGV